MGNFGCCLFVFLVVWFIFFYLFSILIFLALTSRVMARRVASAAARGKISSERYSDDAFSILFCFFDFCVFRFFPYRRMDKYDDLDIVDDMSAFSVLSVPFACRLV